MQLFCFLKLNKNLTKHLHPGIVNTIVIQNLSFKHVTIQSLSANLVKSVAFVSSKRPIQTRFWRLLRLEINVAEKPFVRVTKIGSSLVSGTECTDLMFIVFILLLAM